MSTSIGIIPSPKGFFGGCGICFVSPTVCAGGFVPQAEVFAKYVKSALSVDLSISEDGSIKLCADSSLAPGEYRLSVCADSVSIFAAGADGIGYGLASLLQLAEVRDGKLMIPDYTVTDCPECGWRGLLIDCARSRHSVDLLEKYVDLCWLYKIRYLHLHLSDDEAYTLPSKLFPKLGTEGRSYSFEEIEHLRRYAAKRGISIVPEIDSPGHSTAIREKYPKLFGNTGIICFHRESIDAMRSLFGEVCDLFPESEYIHLGGDESRLGWWLDCDKCIGYGRSLGYCEEDDAPDMTGGEYVMLRYLARFISEMADEVIARGKKPVVWEGFHKATNSMIPKNVTVMSWDNSFQTAPSLIKDGFKVINCSWIPNYVVTPTWFYTQRACFDWDIYSFSSISEESPYFGGKMRLDETDMIIGGQLCSWGDTIGKAFPTLEDGLSDELIKLRERLPATAESTWNRACRTDYCAFRDAYIKCDTIAEKIIEASDLSRK